MIGPSAEERRSKVRKNVRFRYGADYDALLLESCGKCGCCKRNFINRRTEPHVDHHHKSGRVRSLVCHPCNTAIGAVFEDWKKAYLVGEYLILYGAEELPRAANEPMKEEEPVADPQGWLFS